MTQQPLTHKHTAQVPAAAVAVDTETEVCIAEFDAVVSAVTLVAATVITGADTNSRTGQLVNKGQAGAGAVVVASRAFVAAVNAAADDGQAIALSGTAANLNVAAGDVLVWQSNHVGTGIADPGGILEVELTRAG